MIVELPTLIGTYGPWLVLAVTCAGAFGLPAPATLSLIAAGSLSKVSNIDFPILLASAWVGTVTGDHGAYFLGRHIGKGIAKSRMAKALERGERFMARWGMVGVFVSRWLMQSILVPSLNYFSGLSRYPLRKFTPAVALGQLVYASLYTGLGRAFSGQVQQIYSAATTASLLAAALLFGAFCLAYLIFSLFRKGN